MDDEKLIEIVRGKTVLYDLSHPKYMDPKFKMTIWQSIGAEINMTGTQCKKRWTNIRDHFRRHMLKRKTQTGQAAENTKKYKYEDQLQFLLPYSTDRETLTVLCDVPSQNTSAMTEEISEIEEELPEEPNNAEMNQTQTLPSVAEKIVGRSKVRRSQNNPTPSDTPSTLLMKYILDKNDPEKVQQVPSHHIDTFLAGIASTMKNLNPYNQHIAKGRIFNIVHELESQELFCQTPHVQNLSQHSQNSSNTNSPSTSSVNMIINSPESVPLRSERNFDVSRD